MKIKVTLKDPDVLIDAINEALENAFPGLSEEEANAAREVRKEDILDVAGRWFEFGEYLTVEIDTEEKTCRVVPEGE